MKKKYILILVALVAIAISCTDKSLDPMKFDEIKKGTELALRGNMLDRVYNQGLPEAEVFPKIADGTEKFAFQAEYLAQDINSLESVDFYVIKQTSGSTATTRVPLGNVPFSQFVNDGTYIHPWVSVSFNFPDVLAKLGLDNTFTHGDTGKKLSDATITELLTTYQFGINIEADLNLKDGTKVLAADIVASGLFQSNQFYPAQKMNWAMTDFCSYVESSWGGHWYGDEVGVGVGSPPGGDDLGVFVQLAPHTWRMDNFFGDGAGVYATIVFTPSKDPSTQIVQYLNDPGKNYQLTSEGLQLSGSGTYNQCTGLFSINTVYGPYKWVYNFHR